MARVQAQRTGSATRSASKTASTNVKVSADVLAWHVEENQTLLPKECSLCKLGSYTEAGLHKLWYPGIRDMSTWSKFGAHGEHGDVFLFSNLGAL